MNYFILPLLYAFLFAFLTAYIAERKGYESHTWFWLGMFLGVIATGILLFQPSKSVPQ